MKRDDDREQHGGDGAACLAIPRFERINYFYGQMLGVREFRAEQQYFREKLKLHNRYLHGFGTVCGLAVRPCPDKQDPCADASGSSKQEPPAPQPSVAAEKQSYPGQGHGEGHGHGSGSGSGNGNGNGDNSNGNGNGDNGWYPTTRVPCVTLDCGLAIDCLGNEVIVREPLRIDFLDRLDCESRKLLDEGKAEGVWIAVCFVDRPIEPVRPVSVDFCGTTLPDCVYGRVRDDVCVKVWLKRSGDERPHDCACSPCERGCDDPCLVVAAVDRVYQNDRVAWRIDNGVRRTLAPFETTRITGISWTHGAYYTVEEAREMLDEGIEIQFSAPVHAETLRPGVIDIWAIEGGRGRRGQIYHVDGEIECLDGPLVRSVRYRQESRETFQDGDRVIVTLRSNFVLDRCCRAVDGEHIGGRVPITDARDQRWQREQSGPPCVPPEPRSYAPWTSGNGVPGGSFESWFFIKEEDEESSEKSERKR